MQTSFSYLRLTTLPSILCSLISLFPFNPFLLNLTKEPQPWVIPVPASRRPIVLIGFLPVVIKLCNL